MLQWDYFLLFSVAVGFSISQGKRVHGAEPLLNRVRCDSRVRSAVPADMGDARCCLSSKLENVAQFVRRSPESRGRAAGCCAGSGCHSGSLLQGAG